MRGPELPDDTPTIIDDRSSIIAEATALRESCIVAHNRLIRRTRYSVVGAVVRALDVVGLLEEKTAPHFLVSSYAFWGDRRIGGRRSRLEKKLEQLVNDRYMTLYRRLEQGRFGAWKCIDGARDEASTWDLVGGAQAPATSVDLVFDGICNAVESCPGEMRAGWMIDHGGRSMLAFSMELSNKAAKIIADTDARDGWIDHQLADGEERFQRIEYERDILRQAVSPERDKCGLSELYFVPSSQRHGFPERFRAAMLKAMVGSLEDGELPWQIRLATADTEWIDRMLRGELDTMRPDAGRRASRYRGGHIDSARLRRLLSDEECLQLFGIGDDGHISLAQFPPIKTHPVHLLELDRDWFEETAIHPEVSIGRASQQLEGGNPLLADSFETALSVHRARLRWVALMHRLQEIRSLSNWYLSPDYESLRRAAQYLFDPVITDRLVTRIVEDHLRSPARIERAIVEAGRGEPPIRVGDLPLDKALLRSIPGIGAVSVEAIRDGLHQQLLDWPPQLKSETADAGEAARHEIETGLDTLEDLFS